MFIWWASMRMKELGCCASVIKNSLLGLPNSESNNNYEKNGRGDRIRTCDICVPNAALYQAELLPDIG